MSDRGALPSAPPPPPRPQAASGFAWYVDWLARRTFNRVCWRESATTASSMPTLVVANHTNWWDGFLSHQISRARRRQFRILMETEHLDRYRVFKALGALPMERRSPLQAMRDLARAASCLAPGTDVWIYPQGRRTPAPVPIANLEHGAAWMIGRHDGPVQVLPVAFRYPFTSEQLPECWILVGAPWEVAAGEGRDRDAVTARIGAMLSATLAELDTDVAAERIEAFRPLVSGRRSINTRLDRLRHRLGLLDRPRERNG